MLKYDTIEAQQLKKTADVKRKQLADLIAKPLFPKGFSGKYPLHIDESSLTIKTDVKAIDVMKTAMETYAKKKAKPIFKKRKDFQKQKQPENGVAKKIPMKHNNKKRNKK